MNIDEIKRNAPDGATHYMSNRYTGITYLKIGDNITGNYFDCKAWVRKKGWCGELTIKKCWFFGTYYLVCFDSDPWAQTDANPL